MVGDTVPRHQRIGDELRNRILRRIEQEEQTGFVDYITLSPSLLFSMKYGTDLAGFRKKAFYNTVRRTDYPKCADFLDGLEIVSCDYKVLFKQYKDTSNVVFLVDPPYLSTEVGTYKMNWGMDDYLDVLTVLVNHSFVYFTSTKSSIVELCEWMGRNPEVGDPFEGCRRFTFNATMNYSSKYTDMMLCKKAGTTDGNAA